MALLSKNPQINPIFVGPLRLRPKAGVAGRVYIVTDSGGVPNSSAVCISYDDGDVWHEPAFGTNYKPEQLPMNATKYMDGTGKYSIPTGTPGPEGPQGEPGGPGPYDGLLGAFYVTV